MPVSRHHGSPVPSPGARRSLVSVAPRRASLAPRTMHRVALVSLTTLFTFAACATASPAPIDTSRAPASASSSPVPARSTGATAPASRDTVRAPVPLRFDDTPLGPDDAVAVAPAGARIATSVPVPGAPDRDAYFARLRREYPLDSVVAGATTDLERVQRMSRWVRTQWEHNGNNESAHGDPLGILAEARTGKRFRCVEYAEVLAGALSAVGVPARVLGLQRADVETAISGAGHVVAEAWLADRRRWVLVDGQWDVIPFLGDEPIDAVALARALDASTPALRVTSLSGTTSTRYLRWVRPYLYHFVVSPRPWTTGTAPGAPTRMLLPIGAVPPKLFQRKWPQPAYVPTHRPAIFHAPPPTG